MREIGRRIQVIADALLRRGLGNRRDRRRVVAHHLKLDPIRQPIEPLEIAVKAPDHHRVGELAPSERESAANLTQAVEVQRPVERILAHEEAAPLQRRRFLAHRVDHASAADQLVNDKLLLATERDALGHLKTGELEVAELEDGVRHGVATRSGPRPVSKPVMPWLGREACRVILSNTTGTITSATRLPPRLTATGSATCRPPRS